MSNTITTDKAKAALKKEAIATTKKAKKLAKKAADKGIVLVEKNPQTTLYVVGGLVSLYFINKLVQCFKNQV